MLICGANVVVVHDARKEAYSGLFNSCFNCSLSLKSTTLGWFRGASNICAQRISVRKESAAAKGNDVNTGPEFRFAEKNENSCVFDEKLIEPGHFRLLLLPCEVSTGKSSATSIPAQCRMRCFTKVPTSQNRILQNMYYTGPASGPVQSNFDSASTKNRGNLCSYEHLLQMTLSTLSLRPYDGAVMIGEYGASGYDTEIVLDKRSSEMYQMKRGISRIWFECSVTFECVW